MLLLATKTTRAHNLCWWCLYESTHTPTPARPSHDIPSHEAYCISKTKSQKDTAQQYSMHF